jgi:peptidyl-prolyl cis-trans isomerase SurA
MKKSKLILILISFLFLNLNAQNTIDGVEAIVGDKIVLHSEIESQLLQILSQPNSPQTDKQLLRCQVMEDMMFQKLLANQAEVDSLEVTDDEVNSAIDQRIDYFVSQIGSIKKTEKYFNKPIDDIRLEFFSIIKDQILAQRMESSVTSSIKTTPSDVRKFFNSIPVDSLPMFPAQIEMSQLIIFPEVSAYEKERMETQLLEFKKRVENGEDFSFLASLYSEDEGSAKEGGDLGYVTKGKLVPEFESVAFRLQKGEVSNPVKTKYGFHLIQTVDRKGEQFKIRHILLKPNFRLQDYENAKLKLDSIKNLIALDSLTFDQAALKFSQDDSKNNGGIIINVQSGSSSFLLEELDSELSLTIDDLSSGDVSKSVNFTNFDQRKGCRIVKVNKLSSPHIANLQEDYDRIQTVALQELKSQALEKWKAFTLNNTYIKISSNENCESLTNWSK